MKRRSFLLSAGAAAATPSIAQTVGRTDWLIDPKPFVSKVELSGDGRDLTLSNGLLRRVFRLAPNAATIAFDNLMTGESELRSVRPEATVTINSRVVEIGGLKGQPIHNYLLPSWIDGLKSDPQALQFTRYETGKTKERFPWQPRKAWISGNFAWPPPGVSLTLYFEREGMAARVHYELYDGIPLLSKWFEFENRAAAAIHIQSFAAEILAVVEGILPKTDPGMPNELLDPLQHFHVETDYSFGGFMEAPMDNYAVQWKHDPLYTTGIEYYNRQKAALLECTPPIGPALDLEPGKTFTSFRVFELLHDSSDRERRGLAVRRMMRTLAPWSQENPIFMHARYSRPDAVKLAIDQCEATGFEMVILSFGSGFKIENESEEYLAQMSELAAYAKQKNIAIGGYSLLASRGGKPADQVVDRNTGRPGGAHFGPSPCLGSEWGVHHFQQLRRFFERTGMNVFENDGSYPGDRCASTLHPGHRGYEDSQWRQWEIIRDFYRWCRARGIYLTIPDWYFLNGGSKVAMGYVESNWSLPREHQEIIERQNIYDGTWDKTPSMGWMHVPLMQYHGGGAAATIEPLREHLDHYETRLGDLFGAGVQAAYRGERLYDSPETLAVVKRWVDFYKQHREILDGDIIHLRRPDGRNWDGILHVRPGAKMPGLAMIYNPLPQTIEREIELPLYYTGLRGKARITIGDSKRAAVTLDASSRAAIKVELKPRSSVAILVEPF